MHTDKERGLFWRTQGGALRRKSLECSWSAFTFRDDHYVVSSR